MTQIAARPSIAETLISARLSLLQSKRLILATLERRLQQQPVEALRDRVEHMRNETRTAQNSYSFSVLAWGSPNTPGYWPVAYKRLAEVADRLSTSLREASGDMPPTERYELAAEVEMLEQLRSEWRASIRTALTPVA